MTIAGITNVWSGSSSSSVSLAMGPNSIRAKPVSQKPHDALNYCCVFATPGSAQRARHTQMFAQRRACVLGPERPAFLQ